MNSRKSLHTGEGTIRQQNPDKGIAPLIIAERCKNKLEANQTQEFLPRKKARGIMTLGNSGTSQDTGNPSVAYNQRCSPLDEGGNNFGASYNNTNRHETNFGESNNNNNGREAVSSLLTALENKRLASNNSNGSEDMLGASYNNNNGSESVSTPAIPVAKKLPLNSGSEAACVSLSMRKGGPRSSLYELCKRMKWAVPDFQLVEQERLPQTTRFVFRVVLHIPNREKLLVQGDKKIDKNSAKDSAALLMLHEVEKQGLCFIKQ